MPRNIAKALSGAETYRQTMAVEALSEVQAGDGVVEVRYTKRNGDSSSSTGKVAFFNGRVGFDTGSVTIDTPDKGMRTINLHRITSYRRVK